MWDMLGLECVFSIDDAKKVIDNFNKEKVWKILKEESIDCKPPNPIPLALLIVRARANSHRNYEIYSFQTYLSERQVRKTFAANPQPIVEWIRENGNKIYSDYIKQSTRAIV